MGHPKAAGGAGTGPGAGGAGGTKGGKAKGKKGKQPKKQNKKNKKKKKEELECGENGSYGDLQKKGAGGRFERDHVPSAGSLRTRAMQLRGGQGLCKKQEAAIGRMANACAIPIPIHAKYSPTFRGRNTATQMAGDAKNLRKAAQRDTKAVLAGMKKDKVSKKCQKKYAAWAKKVNSTPNSWYDKMIKKAVNKPPA